MTLGAEGIPEDDRGGREREVLQLELFEALLDPARVLSRLTEPGEIAFHIGHEHRHADSTEAFGKPL